MSEQNKPKRGRPKKSTKQEKIHIDVLASRKSTNKAKQEETLGGAWANVPKWLKWSIIVFLLLLVKECVFSKPNACDCIPLLGNRMLGTMEEQKACRKAYVSYNAAARACVGK